MILPKKLTAWLTHPWLALAFRVYLGGLFIYASVYKINYPAEFADSIASYELVPYWIVGVMAVVMPWLELISGVMLVAGIRPKAATLVIMGLMTMFTLSIVITLIRGVPIGCGCFHSLEDPISLKTLVRDTIWLAMTVHIYRYDSKLHLEHLFLVKVRDL
ncbi:MAG: MauE/DoxX family redox-associated membrane protein [Desulfovibrionaceae bacterium]